MSTKNQTDKTRSDFNAFLNLAAKRGELRVQNMRLRTRQPQSEAFSRKAAVAVKRLVPKTHVTVEAVEMDLGKTKSGAAELGAAAAQMMAASSAYAGYLQPKASATPNLASNLELFELLSVYSGFELAQRLGAAGALQSGAVSVLAKATNSEVHVAPDVLAAADSVLAQSFADVHALSLRAAVDGPTAALADLDAVGAAREASGDFTTYALAPLSHDTRSALEVLRSQLRAGIDFGAMGAEALFRNSHWVAREGLAAWMQSHGVEYRAASSLSANMEAIVDVAAAASTKMDPNARPSPRPHH